MGAVKSLYDGPNDKWAGMGGGVAILKSKVCTRRGIRTRGKRLKIVVK